MAENDAYRKSLEDKHRHAYDALQAVEQRSGTLAAQLADKEHLAADLQRQVAALSDKVRALELTLAQAQAKAEAQQGITAELRAFLDSR